MSTSPQFLASTRIAGPQAPARWLWVLHGIYGRGRNWGALARHLLVRRGDWGSLLLDLRLHGDSPAFSPPHTVEAAAGDVLDVELHATEAPRAILGHSFGGKVALLYAARSDVRPLQVWVIDSTPDARAPEGAAWNMLDALRRLPPAFATRQLAVEGLRSHGCAPAVAAWMTTNLAFSDGAYRWRLDVDAMEALLRDFFRLDLWDVVESPPAGVEVEFVKASESATLSDQACARIAEAGRAHGRAHLHRVAGGHWLNTDNPEAVLGLLQARLPRG